MLLFTFCRKIERIQAVSLKQMSKNYENSINHIVAEFSVPSVETLYFCLECINSVENQFSPGSSGTESLQALYHPFQ